MKYITFITLILVSACMQIQAEGDEEEWFKEGYLNPPVEGEARPPWWYDIWGRRGAIAVVSLNVKETRDSINDWKEIIVFDNKNAATKIRLQPKIYQIHQLIYADRMISINDFTLENGANIKIYDRIAPDWFGRWSIKNDDPKLVRHILYFDRVGETITGGYVAKWSASINQKDGIIKVLSASQKADILHNPIK